MQPLTGDEEGVRRMASTADKRAIVVAGGGAAGLSAGLALRQAVGKRYPVIVYDPALAREPLHEKGRAYALAEGSRRMLSVLGVWEHIVADTQPIERMSITDSRLGDVVRQPLLTFDEDAGAHEPLAHMVEGDILVTALREACKQAGVALEPTAITGLQISSPTSPVQVSLANGAECAALFVVAADGKNSPLRRKAGISWIGRPYCQSGIVATIGHERPHEGVAVQHFLPAGTFAMLPLTGNRSSIVWVEAEDDAKTLVTLDADDIIREIERRFGASLGALTLLDAPRAFPLARGVARRLVGDRLALVGDAAHVVHPLAGLGLNVGLRDVAALAEAVADTVRLGLDPSGADTLEAYERARRFDVVSTGLAMDSMNRLFSNDILPLRLVRDFGLGVVDRFPGLKRLLKREAAGLTGSPPRLMRGEML
ncbi:FAD-dependent monooxygenase [Pseudochelatococcus sp. G4_1912]|uniref:FAD-dependent monooxygenase n=1 Tax=Pseudochelatococcus sp. G4_1912 TaxID=3114288 RepID=UPI0039C6562F